MSLLLNLFQSEHILALCIASLIFFVTILLVAKRWIGFSITLILLVFSLVAGLAINHQKDVHHYFNPSFQSTYDSPADFHKSMLQTIEDLKIEVATEKENLSHLMNQVQDIFNSIDVQKQKLQNFIDETREHFKKDYQNKSPNPLLEDLSSSNENSL